LSKAHKLFGFHKCKFIVSGICAFKHPSTKKGNKVGHRHKSLNVERKQPETTMIKGT
jgi:hypothetical protein